MRDAIRPGDGRKPKRREHSIRSRTGLALAVALVLAAHGSAVSAKAPPKAAPAKARGTQATNGAGLSYVPIAPAVFVPGPTISSWAKAFNDPAIANHAWDLWAALSQSSGQSYCVDWQPKRCLTAPIWETWFSEFEVYGVQPLQGAADAAVESNPQGETLAQPWHLARQITGPSAIVTFNKYNLDFKDYVRNNKYNDPATLDALAAKYEAAGTPLQERLVASIPAQAIMLKPTFWLVPADKPSPVPIWRGPGDTIADTTYPERPTDLTWKDIVIVDPTGRASNKNDITRTLVTENGTVTWVNKARSYSVVPLSDFFAVPLSPADIEFLRAGNAFQLGGAHPELGGIDLSKVTPADHILALLVGMHVTTAEYPDYFTWQTFWWTPATTNHPGLKAPFNHFASAQAYYMVGKDGQPHIAFNPHLETPIEGPIFLDPNERGSHSNCMTCHRAAAWPGLGNDPKNPVFGSYIATGNLTRDNTVWFSRRVQTLNMWSMVLENLAGRQTASNTPANPPGK